MRIIDMTQSPRRGQYEYFRTLQNPHVSLTANCDITHLYQVTKERGYPFFLTLLHCVIGAANAVEEFRRRIRGQEVVEYENCISSHTVALPDGGYCYCELDCSRPLEEFLPYAQREVERSKENASLEDGEEAGRLYFVTSVPWVSFTSIHLPVAGADDSNPRITFGKYFRQEGKLLLPLGLQLHHGLVDGAHIARFFEEFARRMENL